VLCTLIELLIKMLFVHAFGTIFISIQT